MQGTSAPNASLYNAWPTRLIIPWLLPFVMIHASESSEIREMRFVAYVKIYLTGYFSCSNNPMLNGVFNFYWNVWVVGDLIPTLDTTRLNRENKIRCRQWIDIDDRFWYFLLRTSTGKKELRNRWRMSSSRVWLGSPVIVDCRQTYHRGFQLVSNQNRPASC